MRIGLTHHRFILFFITLGFCIFFRQVSSQDNQPPTFSDTQYIFSVSEDASIGTILTATNPTTGVSYDQLITRMNMIQLLSAVLVYYSKSMKDILFISNDNCILFLFSVLNYIRVDNGF